MTNTTPADLGLKKANAKYTKAKAAVDGTAAKDKAYQKAKKELAFARQTHAEQRNPGAKPGDAKVTVTAVAAKAKATPKGK